MSRYIDSAEALEAIEDTEWAKPRDKILAMRIVKNVPTANVSTHVHAHWEEYNWENPYAFEGKAWRYRCSECGFEVMNEYNYCPDCGARMEGVM